MQTLRSQDGYSLIQVLIGMGVLTVGMMAAADMMVMNAKSQRNLTSMSEITALYDRIERAVSVDWSCTAALVGADPDAAIAIKDPGQSSKVIAQESADSGRYWSIKSVRMKDVQALPDQPGLYKGTLRIEAQKNMKVTLGAPYMTREIGGIYFDLDPAGNISHCYDTSTTLAAAQTQCELIGGKWDVSAERGKQCAVTLVASVSAPVTTPVVEVPKLEPVKVETPIVVSQSKDKDTDKDNNGNHYGWDNANKDVAKEATKEEKSKSSK